MMPNLALKVSTHVGERRVYEIAAMRDDLGVFSVTLLDPDAATVESAIDLALDVLRQAAIRALVQELAHGEAKR